MKNKKKIVLTGGGTGGHLYPVIAMAEEVKRKNKEVEFLFIGIKGRAEEKVVPSLGYPIKFVLAEGFPRQKKPITFLRFFFKTTLGTLMAAYYLLKFKPSLIISTGGYTSAPVIFANAFLSKTGLIKAKSFIHEQNAIPGKLNLLASKLVDCIGVTFPQTLSFFPQKKSYLVGYPVRRDIGKKDKKEARDILGIKQDSRVLLIIGGSLGSKTINHAIVNALPKLMEKENVVVIHQTGNSPKYNGYKDTIKLLKKKGWQKLPDRYHPLEYIKDIDLYYAASDLVICRGGSGTLHEIMASSLPSIIIPKPGLPGDHQAMNALELKKKRVAKIIYEEISFKNGKSEMAVNPRLLAEKSLTLLFNDKKKTEMSKRAKELFVSNPIDKIGDILQSLLNGSFPENHNKFSFYESYKPSLINLEGNSLINALEEMEKDGKLNLLSQDELKYLKYKADGYLMSERWQTRNNGVKLVGLTKYEKRISFLLYLIKEKKPAPFLHRLLGGDYIQVGFIRRNIIYAIIRIAKWNDDVFNIILEALSDPYFEVRSVAGKAISFFAEVIQKEQKEQFMEFLKRNIHDKNIEVASESIKAVGSIGESNEILKEIERFLIHPNWIIRNALIEALTKLFVRKIISKKEIEMIISKLLLTCNDFQPSFPLKKSLSNLLNIINKK